MTDASTSPERKGSRLLFIDNIRILLICLVITTHSSVTYGGSGSWYFTNADGNPLTQFILTAINSLDQSFFLGFFLLISAYFVPGSLLRKGAAHFTRDRLIRLGIPLLAYVVLINPFVVYLVQAGTGHFSGTFPEFLVSFFVPFTDLQLGPMWFVWFLLLATLAYVAWAHVTKPTADKMHHQFPRYRSIVLFGIFLAIITFIVRIFQPIGSFWLFGFQIPFFTQYIAFFIVGIFAAYNNWLENIPENIGKACAYTGLALVIVQPALIYFLSTAPGGIAPGLGGLHWQSLMYCFWEQMAAVMFTSGLLWLFSRKFNDQGPITRAMGGDSYTVYVIHPVFVVSVALALQYVALPSLAKFALELPMAIFLSFLTAHIIRAIPGAKRIL